MSTIALPPDYESNVTATHLNDLAKRWNLTIKTEEQEASYLLLLQSADAVFREFESVSDYIHPDLAPVATKEPRKYWKPSHPENPNNAWSHRCNIEATEPSSTSLLQGRRIAIKDNICVGGLPTTLGTFAHMLSDDDQYPISPIDATVVRRVLEAGGIIAGTATCENYSAAPISCTSASGAVHNAWARGFTCGGSSSGCGGLLGMDAADPERLQPFGDRVDMAIGGDQGGSIRIPASYNGIYGLKPTHGLIPYTGAITLTPMIDHLGPMTNSLRDMALLLETLVGYDGIDTRMGPESPLRNNIPRYSAILDRIESELGTSSSTPLRIGFLHEGLDIAGLSEDVKNRVLRAKTAFIAAGAEVIDVSVPMHHQGPAIWTVSTRAQMKDWSCAGENAGSLSFNPPHFQLRFPPDQKMYDLLSATNPSIMNMMFSGEYLKETFGPALVSKAHRKIFELRQAYDSALEQVDVLIMPTTPTVAMPHPELIKTDGTPGSMMEKVKVAIGIVSNTSSFNVTGHPAMSMPCGFSTVVHEGEEKKLPVGMQIVAKRFDEEAILRAAAAFEYGVKLGSRLNGRS